MENCSELEYNGLCEIIAMCDFQYDALLCDDVSGDGKYVRLANGEKFWMNESDKILYWIAANGEKRYLIRDMKCFTINDLALIPPFNIFNTKSAERLYAILELARANPRLEDAFFKTDLILQYNIHPIEFFLIDSFLLLIRHYCGLSPHFNRLQCDFRSVVMEKSKPLLDEMNTIIQELTECGFDLEVVEKLILKSDALFIRMQNYPIVEAAMFDMHAHICVLMKDIVAAIYARKYGIIAVNTHLQDVKID